jgi:hypothetical protein
MNGKRVLQILLIIAILVVILFAANSVIESMRMQRQVHAMNGVMLWGHAIEKMWQAHNCVAPSGTPSGPPSGPCPVYNRLPSDGAELVTFARLSHERLPAFDPWGNAFRVSTNPPAYSITCAGADGRFEINPRHGKTYSPDCDIIWEPYSFTQWPENGVEITGALPESAVSQVTGTVAPVAECLPCHARVKWR